MKPRAPLPISTLAELPGYNALEYGDDPVFVFEDRVTSFAEFEDRTNKIANGLLAMGLVKGDRIAFLGMNSDHYFELLLGSMKVGVVMAPIGWRLATPEVLTILKHSESRVLFAEEAFLQPDYDVSNLPDLRAIKLVNDPGGSFEAWRDAQDAMPPKADIVPEDVAVQIYTSGTTGLPKGAMLTHFSILTMRRIMSTVGGDEGKYYPNDVGFLPMPVSHVGGTVSAIWSLYGGIKSIITPQFDPKLVIDFIRDEGVTNFFLVPAALQIVLQDPRVKDTDFSHIRAITYGGSPIPRELLNQLLEVFGPCFKQGYGMTETSATICALYPVDHLGDAPKLRSCGRPLPGVEIEIRDPDGNKLAPGEVGEIHVHGPCNMKGYWRDEEATAKTIDPEGWLASGDAGYLDEDGYLYIHDRVKDMIVSGGENIYPAEVESAVFEHPAVDEVVVVGVPSEKWGEEVKAVVVLKKGQSATPQDIITWSRERLAGYKLPKSVDYLDAMPKNTAGKIMRRQVRDPYWEGRERAI